jgi:hypothetical protein
LVIVDPATGEVLYNGPIRTTPSGPSLTGAGTSLGVATINGKDLAVVNAWGSNLLAVVDISVWPQWELSGRFCADSPDFRTFRPPDPALFGTSNASHCSTG